MILLSSCLVNNEPCFERGEFSNKGQIRMHAYSSGLNYTVRNTPASMHTLVHLRIQDGRSGIYVPPTVGWCRGALASCIPVETHAWSSWSVLVHPSIHPCMHLHGCQVNISCGQVNILEEKKSQHSRGMYRPMNMQFLYSIVKVASSMSTRQLLMSIYTCMRSDR